MYSFVDRSTLTSPEFVFSFKLNSIHMLVTTPRSSRGQEDSQRGTSRQQGPGCLVFLASCSIDFTCLQGRPRHLAFTMTMMKASVAAQQVMKNTAKDSVSA